MDKLDRLGWAAHRAIRTHGVRIGFRATRKSLLATAERWAREMSECSPLAVQASKQAALQGLGRPVAEAMVAHYPLVQKLFTSEDVVEGPRAFAEKRKPVWRGR